jgi:hypothetical protein
MKYVLMILSAALFSVLASATPKAPVTQAQIDLENKGGTASVSSDGAVHTDLTGCHCVPDPNYSAQVGDSTGSGSGANGAKTTLHPGVK